MAAIIQPTPPKAAAKKSAAGVNFEHGLAKALNFGTVARGRLYDRLYRFTARGYPLDVALSGMYERFEKAKDARRIIWRRWLKGLNEGLPFSRLVGEYVPPAERLMIAAGEGTGNIAQGFKAAAYVADASRRMRSALMGALAYPLVLAVLFACLLYFVSVQLMPNMLRMAPLEEWPKNTAALHSASEFVLHYGLLTGALMLAALIASLVSLPRWTRGPRAWLDKAIPPWGIYREMQGAFTLITLGQLVKNGGKPIDAALSEIHRVASPWLRRHINRAERNLLMGKPPAQALDTGLFAYEVVGELQDYDRAGDFANALDAVGQYIVDDTIVRIQVIAGLARNALMLAVGGGLIWVYTAMGSLMMYVQAKAMSGH